MCVVKNLIFIQLSIVVNVRDIALVNHLIHHSQPAYRKGKSTETALTSLMDKVEKVIEDKEIALCVFPDIEGAFDNSSTSLLVNGLVHKNVDPTTITWVKSMLTCRGAKLALHNITIHISTARGCPQGGSVSTKVCCGIHGERPKVSKSINLG